jgi:hypothetical protein
MTLIQRWIVLTSCGLTARSHQGVLELREHDSERSYTSQQVDSWRCSHLHRTRRAAMDCATREAEKRWIVL